MSMAEVEYMHISEHVESPYAFFAEKKIGNEIRKPHFFQFQSVTL